MNHKVLLIYVSSVLCNKNKAERGKRQEREGLKPNKSLTACHKQPEMSSIPFVYSLPEVLLAQEVEVHVEASL